MVAYQPADFVDEPTGIHEAREDFAGGISSRFRVPGKMATSLAVYSKAAGLFDVVQQGCPTDTRLFGDVSQDASGVLEGVVAVEAASLVEVSQREQLGDENAEDIEVFPKNPRSCSASEQAIELSAQPLGMHRGEERSALKDRLGGGVFESELQGGSEGNNNKGCWNV